MSIGSRSDTRAGNFRFDICKAVSQCIWNLRSIIPRFIRRLCYVEICAQHVFRYIKDKLSFPDISRRYIKLNCTTSLGKKIINAGRCTVSKRTKNTIKIMNLYRVYLAGPIHINIRNDLGHQSAERNNI